MGIVKIKGLVKKFGDFVAVDGVDLDIKEGEIYGLLGPNGAGKSTTINILSGLLSFDKGRIEVFGSDINKSRAEIKRNIGIVPQDIAIYEDLTAYENIDFFAGLYGLRGRQLKKSVEEALEFTGLLDKANAMPSSFSGGMKRRLNIACAIAHKPKLIIMDEPTVGIDPQSRNHIIQSVKKLNESGSTIIYTSHYMEEVEELCTRLAIIDHGKLIAEGTKQELKSIVTNTDSIWITIDSLKNFQANEIMSINGVISVDIDEKIVKINTTTDVNNLDKIIQYFISKAISIRNVENKKPDLETVFLTLTGRNLRD
ncbi:ABC transporter ATP-binding protein [Clostridium sp. 19966]|uniref:ABC transporter ATP-binding protein n=1 Tax=Clostridium sp. 19966 TaxID=2768166 RepID=UPI0028DEBBF3|nr:ABC transporter ATP-binding protein [Clostridium sp. 19966]MDT8717215.1 ABC transporter ATP-binding protein [Clostridium sp. 19966]